MATPTPSSDSEDALVAFFHALSAEARREYDALADLDRRFGEDVAAERGGRTSSSSSATGPSERKKP